MCLKLSYHSSISAFSSLETSKMDEVEALKFLYSKIQKTKNNEDFFNSMNE
jgi:transcription termination factor Rho